MTENRSETKWRAMVEAARELHQPSVLVAGEYADRTCAYCIHADDPPLLLERKRGYLNGGRLKVWMHFHEDSHPSCDTCTGGYYETRAHWPCATAVALGVVTPEEDEK